MNSLSSHHTNTTLCFLMRENQVLLAMKKRGFGEGKWNGTGGKQQSSETIEEAATRETKEEIGVIPRALEKVAVLTFHFSKKVERLGECELTSVYICWEWEGEPQESEEMKPQWFPVRYLPLESMWEDDRYWVPRVLQGEKIRGEFWFDDDFKLIKHRVKTQQNLILNS